MKISPHNPRVLKKSPQIQKFVRATRQLLGLSQEDFAKLFDGYAPAIVKNWEVGRTIPRADVFLRILELRCRCLRKKGFHIDEPSIQNG